MRSESIGQLGKGTLTAGEVLRRVATKARLLRRDLSDRDGSGPSVAARQADLAKFYDRYESLVETLCDAAQYGPTPNLESRYAEHRGIMERAYGEVAPFVLSYVRDQDAEDPFLALCQAETLADFLRHDDGEMIHRIMATREALTLYAEHLRQLAAK